MKKYLTSFIISASIIVSGLAILFPAESALGITIWEGCGQSGGGSTTTPTTGGNGGSSKGQLCTAATSGDEDFPKLMKNIINTMLYVVGIIAVIMIIIGGVRYTVSNGESAQIKAAKDTVTYAVIGLVIAILAFAIVNFVVDRFS